MKEPELVEQGWASMQADGITAKVACDTLLGKSHGPVQESSESDSTNRAPDQAYELSEGGPTSSASGEGAGTSERTAEHQDEAAPDSAQQQAVGGTRPRRITRVPDPAASADGFVNATVGTNDVKVPTQQSSGSGLSPTQSSPALVDTAKSTDDAESGAEQDVNARLRACTKVLSSAPGTFPDAAMRRVAVHTLLEAPHDEFDLAVRIAERVGLTESNRFRYVAALGAADDGGVLTMAYAVALATDELHLRSVGDHLDARAADYLKHLHDSAGYDITGYQSALEAISSTKL